MSYDAETGRCRVKLKGRLDGKKHGGSVKMLKPENLLPVGSPLELVIERIAVRVSARESGEAEYLEATRAFRKMISEHKDRNTTCSRIQGVIDAGVVPFFVEFLGRDGNTELQLEAGLIGDESAQSITAIVEWMVGERLSPCERS